MTNYDSLVFSAAGSFASLQRPSQNDALRLDALAMPLFEQLSVDGKRRIAAVLSECRNIIPVQLIEALILQPLDISASLLISRAEIPDNLLEKAIVVGGQSHARVILLRQNLSISIKKRIDTFIESITPMNRPEVAPLEIRVNLKPVVNPKTTLPTELDVAQERLRNMMMRQTFPEQRANSAIAPLATNNDTENDDINIVARLINLAFDADPDFLITALADEWLAPFFTLRALIKRNQLHNLAVLLKGLEFGATDTFAIVTAFNPVAFTTREAIASFYLKFQSISDYEIKALTATFHAETLASENDSGALVA